MTLTSETYKSFILALAELFEEQKDNLCELDRKIGDGDHGVTMNNWLSSCKKYDS